MSEVEHWQLRVKLQTALQVIEDETCPQCGHPVWLCHSTLDSVQWDVEWVTCYADQVVEETKKSRESKRRLNIGEIPRAMLDGEWPTRTAGLESMG